MVEGGCTDLEAIRKKGDREVARRINLLERGERDLLHGEHRDTGTNHECTPFTERKALLDEELFWTESENVSVRSASRGGPTRRTWTRRVLGLRTRLRASRTRA
ncbi:hypothetical protein ACFPRL_17265 [Pseudoclavibacter helvolus]